MNLKSTLVVEEMFFLKEVKMKYKAILKKKIIANVVEHPDNLVSVSCSTEEDEFAFKIEMCSLMQWLRYNEKERIELVHNAVKDVVKIDDYFLDIYLNDDEEIIKSLRDDLDEIGIEYFYDAEEVDVEKIYTPLNYCAVRWNDEREEYFWLDFSQRRKLECYVVTKFTRV